MTFARLTRGDWIAWAAALVLLAALAMDWYGTQLGDEARRIEESAQPNGALAGEVEREVQEDARLVAEGEERNAFQEDGPLDRAILAVLLVSAGLAFLSGLQRAAGRTPGAATETAAAAATAGALLVAYRIVQEPGLDAGTTVKLGAVLALIACAALALGAATALRAEREEAVPA